MQYSSDLITLLGTDLRVIYQSPAVTKILGRSPEEFVGQSLEDVVHPDDVLTAQAQFTKVLTGGLGSTSTFECRVAHADGQWRIIDVVITNLLDEPDVGAIVLNGRDVTERHALEQELNHQAFHDTLTGLANRSLFFDRLSHAMDRGDRERRPGRRPVLGPRRLQDGQRQSRPPGRRPAAGRRRRSESARRTRPGDTVARFGGDEFAVLVEAGTMPEAAQEVAGRIIDALAPTFRVLTNDVAMRPSIGIAIGQRPAGDARRPACATPIWRCTSPSATARDASRCTSPTCTTDAVRRLETEVGIREGLEANQFEVFYQPIVNTHTGRLIAAEALVRWNHPTRGLLAPIEFIPVAEATGLIVPLGRQVLRDAAAPDPGVEAERASSTRTSTSASTSRRINSKKPTWSTTSLGRSDDSGLPPDALVLEVTESALVENLDVTVPRLARPASARRAPGGRRLRHRVLLAQLPRRPAHQLRQDRQVVHRPDHPGRRRFGHGARRHRPQPRHGLHLHRRRRRGRGPALPCSTSSAATSSRDTSSDDRAARSR